MASGLAPTSPRLSLESSPISSKRATPPFDATARSLINGLQPPSVSRCVDLPRVRGSLNLKLTLSCAARRRKSKRSFRQSRNKLSRISKRFKEMCEVSCSTAPTSELLLIARLHFSLPHSLRTRPAGYHQRPRSRDPTWSCSRAPEHPNRGRRVVRSFLLASRRRAPKNLFDSAPARTATSREVVILFSLRRI